MNSLTKHSRHGRSPEARISNVDFLRGIAAVAIVFWHYKQFSYGSTLAFVPETQPLYSIFKLFYDRGHLAVKFFWILSGFVFFHVYRERPGGGAKLFFVQRFARLYPLHFLTLCIVAVLQGINLAALGSYQIYPHNDFKHFALNLFFASHWGLESGYSFNAPIWSVSVEVVVYLLFFLVWRFLRLNILTCVLWILVSAAATRFTRNDILMCSTLFAAGGWISIVSSNMQSRKANAWALGSVMCLIAGAACLVWLQLPGQQLFPYLLFGGLIFSAQTVEKLGFSVGALGGGFGNITYASYLLHVPLQLLLILVMELLLGSREIILSPVFFFFYFALVTASAFFVHQKVELPAKAWVTKVMLKKERRSVFLGQTS